MTFYNIASFFTIEPNKEKINRFLKKSTYLLDKSTKPHSSQEIPHILK